MSDQNPRQEVQDTPCNFLMLSVNLVTRLEGLLSERRSENPVATPTQLQRSSADKREPARRRIISEIFHYGIYASAAKQKLSL